MVLYFIMLRNLGIVRVKADYKLNGFPFKLDFCDYYNWTIEPQKPLHAQMFYFPSVCS